MPTPRPIRLGIEHGHIVAVLAYRLGGVAAPRAAELTYADLAALADQIDAVSARSLDEQYPLTLWRMLTLNLRAAAQAPSAALRAVHMNAAHDGARTAMAFRALRIALVLPEPAAAPQSAEARSPGS